MNLPKKKKHARKEKTLETLGKTKDSGRVA